MASPQIQNLARRLVASEAPSHSAPEARAEAAAQVIDELRVRLIRLAGVDGFRSLLSRALTLAKAEAPALHPVRISADGSLEGCDGIAQCTEEAEAEQAGTVLVAHLLELLVTFIGEPLTLRLLHEAWPGASIEHADSRSEDRA
jgi:hypothetical protein